MAVKELCRLEGFSGAAAHVKWRAKLVGMPASEATRLRETGSENAIPRSRWQAHLIRGMVRAAQARREAVARMVEQFGHRRAPRPTL